MEYIEFIILGLIQGLTEFLPISSSGHLVIAQHLLKIKEKGITLEVFLHIGTLLSIIIYFKSSLLKLLKSVLPPFKKEMAEGRKTILLLIISTLPSVIIALSPIRNLFKEIYNHPKIVGILLIVTGIILFIPKFIPKKNCSDKKINVLSGLIMGISQSFAILPGISRSGITIISGTLSGINPSKAAEFSFLMAIPAILGATLLEIKNTITLDQNLILPYIVATTVAFISGIIAIFIVMKLIRIGKFEFFGMYCLIIGLFVFIYFKNIPQ